MEPTPDSKILEKLEEINQKVDALGNRVSKIESENNIVIEQQPLPENPEPVPAPEPIVEVPAPASPVTEVPVEPIEPKTTVYQEKEKQNFEMRLGTYWFSRIGIVALVIGFALFLIYALQYFGPLGKIGIGFFASAVLMGLGAFLEHRDEKMVTYGQILFGGGVALAYFTTYAMYFFSASKVIDSQVIDLVLLSAISIGYLFYSLRYNKEVLSIIAFFLAVLTMNLGAVVNFSLFALLIFTAVTVFIATKYRWKGLLITASLAAYFTQLHWIISGSPDPRTIMGISLSLILVSALLTFYYISLNVAAALFEPEAENGPKSFYFIFTALNTTLYFLILGSLFGLAYQNVWAPILFVAAATQLGTFLVTRYLMGWEKSSAVWYIFGFISLGLALLIHFHSYALTISWLSIAAVMMFGGFLVDSSRYRITGVIFSLLALVSLLGNYFTTGYPFGVISAVFAITMMVFSGLYIYKPQYSKNEKSLQSLFSTIAFLVTAICLLKILPANSLVIAWSLLSFSFMALSFAIKDKPLRFAGFGLLIINFMALLGNYGTDGYPFGWASLTLAASLLGLSAIYLFNPSAENSSEKSFQSFYSISALVVVSICLMKIVGSNYLTLAWGMTGLGFAALGFAMKDRPLRLAGFSLLLLTILKLFLIDSAGLEPIFKIMSFIALGIILLLISFGYSKYKDVIKRYL